MKRERNLDLLRCLSIFMVMVIHVCGLYFWSTSKLMNKAFIITNFFDAFSRTAVPVFILLSGYFSLNHLVTAQKYIKKIIVKFIIPTIIWIVFYHIFFKVRIEKGVSFKELLDLDYLKGISEVFFSNQGSHLWFMPMFIGLQILTPLLILLRDKLIGQRGFLLLGVAMLLAGMFFVVFRLVVKPVIISNLTSSFIYLGYYILGNALPKTNLRRMKRFVWLVSFFLSSSTIFYLVHRFTAQPELHRLPAIYFYNYLSVFVAISSFSLFMFFYKIKIRTTWVEVVVDRITPNVFFMYFIHNAVLLILIDWLSKFIVIQNHLLIMIPGIAVITFCISFILAEIHRVVALKLRRVFNLKVAS
ncbi:hypothetical protein FH008_14760 [Listeria monocytogenes]|nr:hypothetical protein [Listeria monocytogenes]EBF5125821.1 hypothetical protein [Listeria monocytogenes]EBF5152393.1 hypothetical protein [Listeria monocytogenes]